MGAQFDIGRALLRNAMNQGAIRFVEVLNDFQADAHDYFLSRCDF